MESRRAAKVAHHLYRIALICGGGPLAIGSLIFLLWLIVRDFHLVALGLLLIYPFLLVLGVGVFALIAHIIVAHAGKRAKREHFWMYAFEAVLLILVNFPVAFVMMLVTGFLEFN